MSLFFFSFCAALQKIHNEWNLYLSMRIEGVLFTQQETSWILQYDNIDLLSQSNKNIKNHNVRIIWDCRMAVLFIIITIIATWTYLFNLYEKLLGYVSNQQTFLIGPPADLILNNFISEKEIIFHPTQTHAHIHIK